MNDLSPSQSPLNPYAPPTAHTESFEHTHDEEFVLAGRGSRLGARLLDGLVMMGTMIPAGIIFATRGGIGSDPSAAMSGIMWAGGLFGLSALAVSIYQWYLISTTGQSLGKKWLDLKIVKTDGSPVDFMSGVVLRSWVLGLVGFIPYIGSIIGLIDVLMIFGDERRCLHDQIASTKVVNHFAGA